MANKKTICIALTEKAHKKLKEKARQKGVSVSSLIEMFAMDELGLTEKMVRELKALEDIAFK